jgi:hypothetical protein
MLGLHVGSSVPMRPPYLNLLVEIDGASLIIMMRDFAAERPPSRCPRGERFYRNSAASEGPPSEGH